MNCANSPPTRADYQYPAELKTAERAAIDQRRQVNQQLPDTPLVGLALSGGGVRSATFCLGLCQALARQKLLRRVDVLSTVSGGGYFGSFLGAAFSRPGGSADQVESELSDNHSWSVNWLRENGRFLSPNGSGDNWLSAAVALRNWLALHTVLLTFAFLLLGFAALVRTELSTWSVSSTVWREVELWFWTHSAAGLWWSPWLILPLVPLLLLMIPAGTLYWATQLHALVAVTRPLVALIHTRIRAMDSVQFAAWLQNVLTRGFLLGLIPTVLLSIFAVVDSLGQTLYLHWSGEGFQFPPSWSVPLGMGAAIFAFGRKVSVYLEPLLGTRKFSVPFDVIALVLALLWALLIVVTLGLVACGVAWHWQPVVFEDQFRPMFGNWALVVAVGACFLASWFFSRAFGFVNLSSLQQIYGARIARAYLGATNPLRRKHANHSMTALLPGDDIPWDAYAPQRNGGPIHLINVTLNETLSAQTGIERKDRLGLPMAIGPMGISVGPEAHARWTDFKRVPANRLASLLEQHRHAVQPLECHSQRVGTHPLCGQAAGDDRPLRHVESLPLGRWTAISGAAFTTGAGANTRLGLSLLFGLANVRLGYWWDSGLTGTFRRSIMRTNLMELVSRVFSFCLPVQTCLMTEFLARFHGAARRHWYLSDGGHFENTACYELIRRRIPFIICSDAGQDPAYRFDDFANLVRKARIDFGAEIQVLRRASDRVNDEPGVKFPLPPLEQVVHPSLLNMIGGPSDFLPLPRDASRHPNEAETSTDGFTRKHALLARIHYLDHDTFGWLLLVKPSLMGDEAADVIQYQRTHPLFPQEPTSDQYFDEAQWESYRKLAEHIGVELFTPPAAAWSEGPTWSPSLLRPPDAPPPAAEPPMRVSRRSNSRRSSQPASATA